MKLNEVVIETKRLKLVPINTSHIRPVYKSFTRDISQYMFPQYTGRMEDTETFVMDAMKGLEEGTNLQMVITDKETNRFLGCVGLHHVGKTDPELGVWVRKTAHSNGYGLEAIRGVAAWAKENIEFEHMIYPVDKINRSSRRIAVSIGGKFMKSYRKFNMTRSREMDIAEYWVMK